MAILNTSVVQQMVCLVESVVRRSGHNLTRTEVQRLSKGEVRRHAAVRQVITVIGGTVWVTAGERDYVVAGGESLSLPSDPYPILISSVNGQPASYRLCRQSKGDTSGAAQPGRKQSGNRRSSPGMFTVLER